MDSAVCHLCQKTGDTIECYECEKPTCEACRCHLNREETGLIYCRQCLEAAHPCGRCRTEWTNWEWAEMGCCRHCVYQGMPLETVREYLRILKGYWECHECHAMHYPDGWECEHSSIWRQPLDEPWIRAPTLAEYCAKVAERHETLKAERFAQCDEYHERRKLIRKRDRLQEEQSELRSDIWHTNEELAKKEQKVQTLKKTLKTSTERLEIVEKELKELGDIPLPPHKFRWLPRDDMDLSDTELPRLKERINPLYH